MQYAAYLAYTPDPEPRQSLPLAVIRATTPRQSDLGDLENKQLSVPDLGWQLFTEVPIPVCHVAGDHVTMLGPDTARDVAAAIVNLLAEINSVT